MTRGWDMYMVSSSRGSYNMQQGMRMKQQEVKEILKARRGALRKLGVRSLSLFGSVARNEARPGSDVDLLLEVERPMGLFGISRIQSYIEQALGGTEVDLVIKGAILPELKEDILQGAVRVI
jgi:uncharacterized protein